LVQWRYILPRSKYSNFKVPIHCQLHLILILIQCDTLNIPFKANIRHMKCDLSGMLKEVLLPTQNNSRLRFEKLVFWHQKFPKNTWKWQNYPKTVANYRWKNRQHLTLISTVVNYYWLDCLFSISMTRGYTIFFSLFQLFVLWCFRFTTIAVIYFLFFNLGEITIAMITIVE